MSEQNSLRTPDDSLAKCTNVQQIWDSTVLQDAPIKNNPVWKI